MLFFRVSFGGARFAPVFLACVAVAGCQPRIVRVDCLGFRFPVLSDPQET